MFHRANAFNANLSGWNVSSFLDTTNMFAQTKSFQGYGLDAWQLNESATVKDMFCNAEVVNQSYISNWGIPVQDMLC